MFLLKIGTEGYGLNKQSSYDEVPLPPDETLVTNNIVLNYFNIFIVCLTSRPTAEVKTGR